MENPYDQFNTPEANPYDQFTNPAVTKPEIDTSVAPLRDPTILGEAAAGLKEMGKSFSSVGTKRDGGLLDTPAAQLGLGAVRLAAAPYAPIDSLAAQAGAATQDYLLKQGVNPTLASILATTADLGTNIVGTAGTGIIKKGAELLLPKTMARVEGAIPAMLRPGRQVAKDARAAGDAEIAAVDKQLAQSTEDVAFENARLKQNAKTLNETMPNKPEADKLAGGVVAKDVGTDYSKHYRDTLAKRKDVANNLYDNALGPRAAGEASAIDKVEKLGDKSMSLWDEMQKAKGTANEASTQKAYYDFLNNPQGTQGAGLHELHDELIATRREHRIATSRENDNAARLLGIKEKGILNQMEATKPGSVAELAKADSYYKTDFAPYFSKGAVTRAIESRDPSAIARNAVRPPSLGGKEVQTIDRVVELVGKDSPLHRQIGQAHFGQLIDDAGKSKDFRDGLVKAWDKYASPSGNHNEVLRKAYGADYQNYESLVNQFRTAKSLDLKSVVKDAFNQGKSELQKQGVLATAQKKAIEERVAAQIEKATGKPHDYNAGKFIGPLLITEGLIHTAMGNAAMGSAQILSGTGVMVARTTLGKVMQFKQGRSIMKSLVRSAPGSNQMFASARLLQNFLRNLPQDNEEKLQQ